MLAHARPRDSATFPIALRNEPVWSLVDGIGFASATLPCYLEPQHASLIRGAHVVLDSTYGPLWHGIAWGRPRLHEPLECAGYGVVATYRRKEATYAETRTSEWFERTYEERFKEWTCQVDGPRLRVAYSANTTWPAGSYNGFVLRIPTTAGSRVELSWARPSNAWKLSLYWGTWNPRASDGHEANGAWTDDHTIIDSGSGGTSGTYAHTITDAHDTLMLLVRHPAGASPVTNGSCYFANVIVYGVDDVETTSIYNVATDVLANEVDPFYLPADGLDYVDSGLTDEIVPLIFDAEATANDKLIELMRYAPASFGWYCGRYGQTTAPLPFFFSRSTEPDYFVDLDEYEHDIEDGAFEPLASAIRVFYEPTDHKASPYVDVYDDDESHYLVRRGMNTSTTAKFADSFKAQTSSSATATTLGEQALSDLGRDQFRGSVSGSRLKKGSGVIAPACLARPGQMIRVFGSDISGYIDAMIREVEGVGEDNIRLVLDNTPYRLDIALARMEKHDER